MANSQPIWAQREPAEYVFKHMWEDRRGKNIEILDTNRKQQHVKSICTVSVLALDFLTLPGWLCVPAKSIHPSLPECAKPAVRDRRQEHTLAEVMPRGEKWRKWQKMKKDAEGKKMQERKSNHTLPGFA